MKKKIKPQSSEMRAKLSFDEGYAETPIYRIVSKVTDKEKGIGMMNLIQDMFNISEEDRRLVIKETLKEIREKSVEWGKFDKIKWTKDKEGKIISPYASKKKITDSKN